MLKPRPALIAVEETEVRFSTEVEVGVGVGAELGAGEERVVDATRIAHAKNGRSFIEGNRYLTVSATDFNSKKRLDSSSVTVSQFYCDR
jgi:hypothetical protein